MASSQDIDYVPYTRQRKRAPSPSAGTMLARVEDLAPKQDSGSTDATTRRRPPAPPPPPIPLKDGEGASSFSRGRSTYRPNTLSRAVPPQAAVIPPYMAQVSAAKRRSRSAPPPTRFAGSNISGVTTRVQVLRSRSGHSGPGAPPVLDPFGEDTRCAPEDDFGSVIGAAEHPSNTADDGPSPTGTLRIRSSLKQDKPVHFAAPGRGEDTDFVMVENGGRNGGSHSAGVTDDEAGIGSDPAVEVMRVPAAKTRKPRFGTPSREHATADPGERAGSVSEDEDEMLARMNQADNMLSSKQRRQIVKEEAKNNKTLSKIIKKEGKSEKKALSFAMSELEDLQRLHRQTVKLEAKALTSHSKTLSNYTKILSTFEEIKKKYQGLETKVQSAATQLNQADRTLAEHKERAREAMDRTKEKREEVEVLRKQYGVEERERVVHLGELTGEAAEGDGMARQKTVRGKSRFGGIMG